MIFPYLDTCTLLFDFNIPHCKALNHILSGIYQID